MKYLFYSLSLCFSFCTWGQSSSEGKYIPSVPGLKLVQDASIIQYKGRGSNDLNRGYSNKVKASVERALLNAARQEVQSHLEKQRVKRIYKDRAFNKEEVIASYWENSQTGKISEKSWWELSEEEKSNHRASFAQYWAKPYKKSGAEEFEEEIAFAWAQSKTGQLDGRTWRKLPENEKISLRENYLERKKRGLLAQKKSVPQLDYKLAWASLKSKDLVEKHWWELAPEDRNNFRETFHELTRITPEILLAINATKNKNSAMLAKR